MHLHLKSASLLSLVYSCGERASVVWDKMVKGYLMDIDKLDWLILDALADDYESMNQIYPIDEYPQMTRNDIVDRVHSLYERGYLYLMNNIAFDVAKLKSEPEGYLDTKFWFGMTEIGAEVWDSSSEKYGGYKQDWSKSWSQSTDCQKREGVIYATSKEICFKRLEATPGADVENAKISPVSEFRAKYYKVIKGGFKLEFKINEASKQKAKWQKNIGFNSNNKFNEKFFNKPVVIFLPVIISLAAFVLHYLITFIFYKVRFLSATMLFIAFPVIFWFGAMLWISLAQGILGIAILFKNQKVGALHLYSAISVVALYYVIMWSINVTRFIMTN